MKRVISLVLSVMLVLGLGIGFAGCGAQASAPATGPVADAANAYFANMPADIYKISEKDFIAKVKAGEGMFIMDVRQPDAYAKGHVKGAVNIPFGQAIADNIDKLPKDKPIMLYCYTGQTAGQTVALLNIAGYNAKSVNLGWDLGISKADGAADITETTANALDTSVSTQVAPEIKTAVASYFKGMDALKGTTYANYKISEDNAKKLLDTKDKSAMFLSVRAAKDYAAGHIEGAMNIPFEKGMQASFSKLPKNKKIIVYCYTGQTAGQTVAVLRLLGYDAVSMNSGMGTPATGSAGWVNKGYPVVK